MSAQNSTPATSSTSSVTDARAVTSKATATASKSGSVQSPGTPKVTGVAMALDQSKKSDAPDTNGTSTNPAKTSATPEQQSPKAINADKNADSANEERTTGSGEQQAPGTKKKEQSKTDKTAHSTGRDKGKTTQQAPSESKGKTDAARQAPNDSQAQVDANGQNPDSGKQALGDSQTQNRTDKQASNSGREKGQTEKQALEDSQDKDGKNATQKEKPKNSADKGKHSASVAKFPSIAPSTPDSTAQTSTPEEDDGKHYSPSKGYYLECFLREVVINVRRNPMMSVASISTVMVLALILGLFVVIVANLDNLASQLAGEMQIKVYMTSDFDAQTAEQRIQEILSLEHVVQVTFVPKDVAFTKLQDSLEAQISLDDLEVNPLPDAFEVPVDHPDNLQAVADQLKVMSCVDKVDYGRDMAQRLLKLNSIVRLVGVVVLVLLLASTLLIVSNTIRLTVFARRKEIDIMQLVGAADWFIRWPFILEGITQGLVGAGLAALALDFAYRMVVPQIQRSITFIPVLPPNDIMPYLCVGVALMGCLVGALGSWFSVNRYLKA